MHLPVLGGNSAKKRASGGVPKKKDPKNKSNENSLLEGRPNVGSLTALRKNRRKKVIGRMWGKGGVSREKGWAQEKEPTFCCPPTDGKAI